MKPRLHKKSKVKKVTKLSEELLQGNPDAVCSAEGQWAAGGGGSGTPSCVPRPCGYPRLPAHATARFEAEGGYDLGYGSRAHLACEPGYVVEAARGGGKAADGAGVAASSLLCTEDGTWQGQLLTCVKVSPTSAPLYVYSTLYHTVCTCTVHCTVQCTVASLKKLIHSLRTL